MSFQSATAAAPADADFIAYLTINTWIVIERRSDGIFDVCANLTSNGYATFVAGVSAERLSLWSFESQQFITGTAEQLTRQPATQEA